ncbi:nucleotidyltransferase family protein [Methylobacterium sp. sgz302541]|uniref:nucleotidyltransferase family protein n=1 Tax=unclassified Methylobacterium TaxID=2615210 RepID=UPI003D344B81
MSPSDVIAILRRHQADLRDRGVRHAALFGSTARGENAPQSDIDILVEIDQDRVRDVYDYTGLIAYIGDLFPVVVDVANRDALTAHVREGAERDAIHAF